MIYIIGAFLVGLPFIIIGLIAVWREHQVDKMEQ